MGMTALGLFASGAQGAVDFAAPVSYNADSPADITRPWQ
jgi:hypothetical protein